ncbi:HAMP domain-containing sensor histidine kinase [Thiothrix fructosivorans]|uniref:histidine kinase n=1 Tax=Thiothrix fructosivorans TaxID=111770 RepID=A0A8B0SLI7_9GAMM|nr:HAMP domain-containing sensor histidine kinase [Thiothrix fructosivorans]MBO0612318.1 HAMP domain-containing histidine kinase [Thiothrix fructosivorans]QTX12196.1 HAMP domain-containing histidine kinase [Thiothrix fructosivorans]
MPINAHLPLPRKTLFRLRSILLLVMLAVLALPLGGLYFFRIYENELVQQTELELISQSAVLAATFRQFVRDQRREEDYGYVQFSSSLTLPDNPYLHKPQPLDDTFYAPVTPRVDLIDPIAPPRPDARPSTQATDPLAHKIGVHMSHILQDTQQVTLSGIRLLDANGTVIAGREEVGLSLAHIPEIKQALQGKYASVIRQRVSDEPPPPLYSVSRGTHVRIFTAFPVIEEGRLQGVVYLSRTPTNIIKHLYENKGVVLLATLSLLVLAVLLILLVSSTISRPIRELLRQTERVRQGEQREVEPIHNPVTKEIAQLSESFAGMSHALAERSDYIRRFATHVSHEFKTPLTAIQGALELLHDHIDTMPMERRERFIQNLLDDTQRLKRLVNRLLELARADSLETSKDSSTLTNLFKALRNRYQDRGLILHFGNPLPSTALAIAPDALEAVVTNLLDNSLQHGATQVNLYTHGGSDTLRLRLHDNGNGISAANRDKIFTPFFTTKRTKGGTGLGLEIVTSILKAYGGNIRLGDATSGAEFILNLPVEKH